MLLRVSALVLGITLISQSGIADDGNGKHLFETHCASCHGASGGMDLKKRVAPPIAAVKMHYIDIYPDQTAFVQSISAWVESQDESKSLMRGAIRNFGLMPPLSLPREDVIKIATYIYSGDIHEPKGFKEHVEEEHGKKGEGHGQKHKEKVN